MRGATPFEAIEDIIDTISIHAPRAGSDQWVSQLAPRDSYFNPRSPCGERLLTTLVLLNRFSISIHAPRAGSDQTADFINCIAFGFQSTLPVRGATWLIPCSSAYSAFQSTLPVRGATKKDVIDVYKTQISIHAPRAGSDDRRKTSLCKKHNFNPRSPCGERPFSCLFLKIHVPFQSTLPVRGATQSY